MANLVRITGKSEELRGASQPNILELSFASDADAITASANLALLMSGQIVSVDEEIATNYDLPYPAGTGVMCRAAAFDGVGQWENFAVMDLKLPFSEETRSAALIAAGFQIWNQQTGAMVTPVAINVSVFVPLKSV